MAAECNVDSAIMTDDRMPISSETLVIDVASPSESPSSLEDVLNGNSFISESESGRGLSSSKSSCSIDNVQTNGSSNEDRSPREEHDNTVIAVNNISSQPHQESIMESCNDSCDSNETRPSKLLDPASIRKSVEEKSKTEEAALEQAPSTFLCPISTEIMRDPVTLMTGITYERHNIERWLRTQVHNSQVPRCPGTNQAVKMPVILVPNIALKKTIYDYLEKNAPHTLMTMLSEKFEADVAKEREKKIPSNISGHLDSDGDFAYAAALQHEEDNSASRSNSRENEDMPLTIDSTQDSVLTREEMEVARRRMRRNSFEITRRERSQQLRALSSNTRDGIAAVDASSLRTPYKTIAFPAIMIAHVFFFSVMLIRKVETWERNPLFGSDTDTMLAYGAMSTSRVYDNGSSWRLLTCIFIPAGLIELMVLICMTFKIGLCLERRWGTIRMMSVCLVASICAALSTSIFVPKTTATAGASYVYISALGMFLYHIAVHKQSILDIRSGLADLEDKFFCVRVACCLLLGIFPFVGLIQSVLALIFGFLASAVIIPPPLYGNSARKMCDGIAISQFISSVLILSSLTFGGLILYKKLDTTSVCPSCYNINCIETNLWTCSKLP